MFERAPTNDPEIFFDNTKNATREFSLAKKHYESLQNKGASFPVEIGPTAKASLLLELPKIQGYVSRVKVEDLLDLLLNAGVYVETSEDPQPEEPSAIEPVTHDTQTNTPLRNTDVFSPQPIGLKVVTIDGGQQEILAANLAKFEEEQQTLRLKEAAEQQEFTIQEFERLFYSKKHISEMAGKLNDWYTFSIDQEEDFRKIFAATGPENLSKAIAYIRGTLAKLQKKEQSDKTILEHLKKLAVLAEHALTHTIAKYKWFGNLIKLIPTQMYDDLHAKTDCVLEYVDSIRPENTTYTAVDATFANIKSPDFKEKIHDVLDAIRIGEPTQLEFYQNSQNQAMEPFTLPRIILHLDPTELNTLLHIEDCWQRDLDDTDYRDKSHGHSILHKLIEQTKVYIELADYYENSDMRNRYATTLATLEKSARMSGLQLTDQAEPLAITKRIRDIVDEYKKTHPKDVMAFALKALEMFGINKK